MAGPDIASNLNKRLLYVIITSAVLDGEDKSVQASFNKVFNWAQNVSGQTLREFFSGQHDKCIAILARSIAAWVLKKTKKWQHCERLGSQPLLIMREEAEGQLRYQLRIPWMLSEE